MKIKGTTTSIKVLEIQWSGTWQDITSIVQDKLQCPTCLAIEKEAQQLVSLFRFQRQHIPHLVILFNRHVRCNESFQQETELERVLEQVQSVSKWLSHFGHFPCRSNKIGDKCDEKKCTGQKYESPNPRHSVVHFWNLGFLHLQMLWV